MYSGDDSADLFQSSTPGHCAGFFIGGFQLEHFEPDTRAERLAKALLADNAVRAARQVRHNIIACLSCGHTFVYRGRRGAASVWIGSDEDGHPSPDTSLNGRFCSMRCQEWFDDGNPSFEEQQEHERKLLKAPLESFVVLAGPHGIEAGAGYYATVGFKSTPMRRGSEGFYIACKHCNKEFESKGLRCCSQDCERGDRESEANLAIMKEAGIEPVAKRMCQGPSCERSIPKWKNGRQVSTKVRFCSSICRKRSAQAA